MKSCSDELRLFLTKQEVIDRLPDWALRRLEDFVDEYVKNRVGEVLQNDFLKDDE